MSDHSTVRAQTVLPAQPVCTAQDPFGERQVAGNQAALDAMVAEPETDSWLDGLFHLAEPMGAAPDLFGFGDLEAPAPAAREDGISDFAGLPKSQATGASRGNGIVAGPDGVTVQAGHRTTHDNAFLGENTSTTSAIAGVAADGTLTAGGRRTEAMDDNQVGVGVTVSSAGLVTAGGTAKVGQVGGSAEGSVDLGEDGQLEAVGGRVGVDLGGNTVDTGIAVQLEQVDVTGTTVSWRSGHALDANARVAGVGAGHAIHASEQQTMTFATAAEARAFAARVRAGEHTPNDALTSDQVAAMEPGTRYTFERKASDTAKGSFVIGGSAAANTHERVEVQRTEGGGVTLTVTAKDTAEGGVAASNGVLSVNGTAAKDRERSATYALDLTDPVQRAAFDAFQATGVLPEGVRPTDATDLSGITTGRGATAPGMSIRQSRGTASGTVVEDGRAYEVVRGTQQDTTFTGSRYDIPVAIGKMLEGAAYAADLVAPWTSDAIRDSAGRWKRYGEHHRKARLAAEGSTNGTESNELRVYAPAGSTGQERLDGLTMRSVQKVDFSDPAQSARFLQDQVQPGVDAHEVDPALLPAHGAGGRAWTLETVIDEVGTKAVSEALAQDGDFSFEWDAAKNIEGWKRSNPDRGTDPVAFADAVAQLTAAGGADTVEGVRDIAGGEHAERFLAREGDSVWIGREASARLDERAALHAGQAGAGSPGAALLESERARLARLQDPRRDPEVPEALRAEEIARTQRRIDRLQGGV